MCTATREVSDEAPVSRTKYHTDVCTATRVPPRALARSLLVASGPCEPANAVRTGERETGSCEEGRSNNNQLAPKSTLCVCTRRHVCDSSTYRDHIVLAVTSSTKYPSTVVGGGRNDG